ncbi:unnamed protein product [Ostreobium quekettii]|uniref:Uncharacterized protein n=1 Tax=Ostreobium quekettii TaxID=121088 RepID=A0A8S1IRJ3_9CHLO|nr:unnamed protein product [Ostreobium quekettii]|eukprot:evm.model.scf_108.7 EVM.evm.TU.scf_108.7   scf_108:46070-48927(-)
MYNIMLMAKKLGEDPKHGVATIRCFGKFWGLFADYYVFETTLKEAPEEEEENLGGLRIYLQFTDSLNSYIEEGCVPPEKGSGANAYSYFVCSYLGGPFTKLPDVRPEQIKAARNLKRFLVGRLDSSVSNYPPFPGKEANFLRAQIARISSTTVLCPSGYFNVSEEGEIEKNEEFQSLESREMGNATNWSHRHPHLKRQGRCQPHVREPPEGEEEEFVPTEEEQEQGPEPLATLENDAEVNAGPAWTPLYSSHNENVKYQVACVRSNLWPGACAVWGGGRFANIYVGWGIKNLPLTPLPPPPINPEFDLALMESTELPPKPAEEEPAEGEEEA